MRAVHRGGAAEGVVETGAAAKTISRRWQSKKSASELFVPDAEIGVRRRIGVGVVREPAVVVVERVARIINRPATFRIRLRADIAGVRQAVPENHDSSERWS